MSPVLNNCQNRCLHCWRAIELTSGDKFKGKIDKPNKIIEECIKAQRKLLTGFKGNSKVNMKKWKEAQEPQNFAISLIGEPTLYPKLGEMISELRKRKIITFLVTNGLNPEKIKELTKENQLPTQFTISLNTSNEKLYNLWHRSSKRGAWKKLNECLSLMKALKGKTRRAIRLNLVKKDLGDSSFIGQLSNMENNHVKEYVKLILKAMPDFIHVDGFKSIGSARERMSWKKMPNFNEVKEFAKKLQEGLNDKGYKIMGEEKRSAVVLISNKKKSALKIKKV